MAGQVEKVYAREDDEKSTEEGDGVHCVGSVESLEENKRSAKRSGREGDVVERVHAGDY